ncbi:hypothetical protein R3P38DRAFT_3123300 [Favolaschia claudopus]|uniref:Uncharacterized protein n=1 Tax=Favolaschia claudopus TaxID=2862362 RepID=A0AAV9ZCS9_9AGAR
MIDPVYLVLLFLLVVTNLGRLKQTVHWVYELIFGARGPRLVPLYDRQGQLIGMVRLRPQGTQEQQRLHAATFAAESSRAIQLNPEFMLPHTQPSRELQRLTITAPTEASQAADRKLRRTTTSSRVQLSETVHRVATPAESSESNPTARSSRPAPARPPLETPSSAVDAGTQIRVWDGWPNGQFQYLFSPQQLADTDNLAINWACESRPQGHRGSTAAVSWRKGKEVRRRCIGALVCTSRACSFNLTAAPAVRGFDLERQLRKKCLCGEDLGLVACGIDISVFFFRGGACFVHSGEHTHGKYTHSLIHRPREAFEFAEYVAKRPISLEASSLTEGSHFRADVKFASESSIKDPAEDSGDQSDAVEVTKELYIDDSDTDTAERREEEDDPEANLGED